MVVIGMMVGLVLCILQGANAVNIGWFWATFPFWVWAPIDISLLVLKEYVDSFLRYIKYIKKNKNH